MRCRRRRAWRATRTRARCCVCCAAARRSCWPSGCPESESSGRASACMLQSHSSHAAARRDVLQLLPGACDVVSARRDGPHSHGVQRAFSLAALAAVPVAAQACPASTASGSSSSSSRKMQLLDLLILQPSGRLLLHRGARPLVAVTLQLPASCLQLLQAECEAAAQRRQQQPAGRGLDTPAQRRHSTAGSLGCRSMSECSDDDAPGCITDDGDDMMLASPGEQGRHVFAVLQCGRLCLC